MEKVRLRDTWVLRKHELARLGIIYVAFSAAWFVVGWLLTRPLKDSFIVHNDERIARWFEKKQGRFNSLSFVGSMMSDTVVKILVTAVVAIVMLIVWKRWLEPLVVCVALILEALTFITVTTLVGRPRPDVPHLDTSPVGSSYPSGHTGAAVAYSAIVVVLLWHTRRRWIRALSIAVVAILPILVGLARVYRGMHFFTDVVFGALLGGASVIAAVKVLTRAAADHHIEVAPRVEEHPSAPDLAHA
ncbi:MAG TPA: phosphatase PAP2 family protein [Ilumatobacteraceae bacterium]|nr:phosphatase PAP2 family protein [Ilumatobacteraceae bacterium]